jgi:hypothetical protein
MEQRPGLRILSFERQRYERALEEHLGDSVFRQAAGESGRLSPTAAVDEALAAD